MIRITPVIRRGMFVAGAAWFLAVSPALAVSPRPSGRTVRFFPGQKQVQEITWRKNGQITRRRLFHRNGKVAQDHVYRAGYPVVKKEYYENGRLKSVWTAKKQTAAHYAADGSRSKKTRKGKGRRVREVSDAVRSGK